MKHLRADNFVTDVAKLMAGTAGGRVILLAAMPLATRLYSPDEFALLAVYMALVNTIAVVACLRLELAIPLASNDRDAAHLLIMALIASAILTSILLAIVTLTPTATAALIGTPEMAPFLWLVPVGIALASSYSALQFWATRARRFGAIARTRIAQATAGAATILGLGALNFTPLGLLLGNMITVGAGGGALAVSALRHDSATLRIVTLAGMKDVLKRFRRYPLFSSPEALANIAGIQVPILIIAAFSQSEAGQLFLAMQIMAAPMMLLGTSIAQVYASRSAEKLAAGELADFTFSLLRRLLLLGLVPLALLGLLAPFVISIIFGDQWDMAGKMMAYMVPWMVLQFMASPISIVMMTTERQRQMLALTIFGGVLRISAVAAAYTIGAELIALAYFAASALFYLVCLGVFAHAAGVTRLLAARQLALGLLVGLAAYAGILSQLPGAQL